MKDTTVAAIGTVVALVGIPSALLWSRWDERERIRQAGIDEAERDIANGRPSLRVRFSDQKSGTPQLTAEGLGIDRATGIPLDNTYSWCGTDHELEEIADAAYNGRIREAHAAGRLERLRLDHKLRTRVDITALFARAASFRLAEDGDSMETPDGAYTLVLDAVRERRALKVGERDREPCWVDLAHSLPTENEWEVETRPAPGPFEGVMADDGTSVVLRDREGGAWVIDLPRALVVQYLARGP